MTRSRGLALLAGTAIGLAACGGTSSGGSSTGTIHIGFTGMLAGKYQNYGVDAKDGVQLAIDEANSNGGITVGGTKYTLVLDAQDDNADPQQGVTAAQALVDKKVVADIGGIFSGATIAESKIFHDAGIPQISPSATNPKYTEQGFNTAFRIIGRDDQQGPGDGDYMVKTLNLKKIAVVDDKSTYGQGLADQVAAQVAKDGATVVDREHVSTDASDFKSQLTTIKGKKPDGIFYGGYSAQAGPFSKQAKDLGVTVPIVMGDGCQDDDYIKLAGDAANGNYASNGGPAHTLMPGWTDFSAKFKAKFNVDVFQYAPQAYDAANLIISYIKKDGNDKAKLVADIASTKNFQGVAQSYSLNAKGDLTAGIFTIYKVDAGKFGPVKAITIDAAS